jgi:hypothetical protein
VLQSQEQGLLPAAEPCTSATCTGVVGAVVLPVTGATVGLVQVTRGAINTVEAVSEASKGKIWDEVRRKEIARLPAPPKHEHPEHEHEHDEDWLIDCRSTVDGLTSLTEPSSQQRQPRHLHVPSSSPQLVGVCEIQQSHSHWWHTIVQVKHAVYVNIMSPVLRCRCRLL